LDRSLARENRYLGNKCFIVPNPEIRNKAEEESSAGIRNCWTCGSCDFECPINIFTGHLRPQKIVRMANLGLLEELLELPEIWYCISCRRCGQVCPNVVKPWALIEYVRLTAIFRKRVSWKVIQAYRNLWVRFQKVRWQVVQVGLQGREIINISDEQWYGWLDKKIPKPDGIIHQGLGTPYSKILKTWNKHYLTTNCFTCSECGSVCPVSCERAIFDPSAIVRMVNLGMVEELLVSSSIWLCLQCHRCSECCSQMVDIAKLIQALQELSFSSGAVSFELRNRIDKSYQLIYQRLILEINQLMGL
jgi:heterodisulfide reductase subunit C